MIYLRTFLRKLPQAILLSGTWLATSGPAWGYFQPPPPGAQESGSGGNAYVFPYFLVIVGIGLGLAVTCMPSRRRDKAKPDDYQEKKLA